LLPQATALWLGDPLARQAVGSDLRAWLLRRAMDGTVPSARAARLAPAQVDSLASGIADAPAEWVASAAITPSVAPCLSPDGHLRPAPVLLRLFLVQDGAAWHALPGGLARVPAGPDPLRPDALRPEPLWKDVWVPADEPDGLPAVVRGLPAPPAIEIRRGSGDLPSRVADDFYWLGRYLERMESSARLLRSAAARLARPNPTAREAAELDTLNRCLVRAELLPAEAAHGLGPGPMTDALLRAAGEAGPLGSQIGQVGRLTALLRDRLTGEMQAALAASLRAVGERLRGGGPGGGGPGGAAGIARLGAVADVILGFSATVAGLAAENMVRGGGRLFLDFGRRVERAQAVAAWVARALDQPGAASHPGRIEPGLRVALELCDSVITYRSRYLSLIQPAPVLDLVLADEGNPRGLGFQLAAARDMLSELDGTAMPHAMPALADGAEALREEVQAMVAGVAGTPMQAEAALALPPRLTAIEGAVAALSDRVSGRYFAVLPVAHSLGIEGAARLTTHRPGIA
jgi:uncharacterized alpha-E superfamily protein